MSCSTFLLVNWFSKKQDAITGGILVFLLLLLLSSYIYLTVVWKKPNFGKKYFAFIVGFFVFLLLVLISGIVFHLVSKAKPKECLPAAVPCPIPWTGYGEKCYFFSATEANWTHSQNHCTSQGGSLVTMETLEERDFIKRHRDRIGYWIGLWREGLSQSWMQPDGSLFDQTFPIKGEGLCAYLNGPVFSSTWCTNTRFWICSKPVT
ncbi:C-type lectin domain family 2 member B-like [Tiliqua scincoides]|uniref:C-type lectin domain family 2 member B-like n=1 Tax=Tiliqua scincoides TaxID=71010 RepID=UPI0034621CA4